MKEWILTQEQPCDSIVSKEYVEAMTHKCEAEQKKAEGLFADAVDLYEKGIAALGDKDYSTNALDDTGMRLVLAQASKEQGKHEMAANLLHSVLVSRIDSAMQAQTKKQTLDDAA